MTREEEIGSIEQPEPWTDRDDPSIFSFAMERRASALPASGEAVPIPWPGSYWPTYQDSIDYKWDGPRSQSAAKKYELAFGGTGLEDTVSQVYGIDSLPRAKVCDTERDCEDGEACAKRADAPKGRCIPTWFGMCHGWAAASIRFPEPKHPVVMNGVTFKVQDIKALVSLAHDTNVARFLSDRCEDSESKGTVKYDKYGRPPPACRDTNPGTFHIVLTNFLGVHKQAFILDQDFDEHVWNHPVRGYTIVEQKPVTVEEAHQLIGVPPPSNDTPDGGAPSAPDGGSPPPPPKYIFNPAAASLLHVTTDVATMLGASPESDGNLASRADTFTAVTRYEYVLELDADGNIIGGEWAGDNKRNHPDFLWVPIDVGSRLFANGKINYANVRNLVLASVGPVQVPAARATASATATRTATTTTTRTATAPPRATASATTTTTTTSRPPR